MTGDDRPAGPPPLLSVRDLSKRFGPTPALAGADLIVRERDIVGLVGPSGAGKSALLNVIAGNSRYDGGEIAFRGYPINLRNRRDGLRIGIAFVPQDARLMPDLSVYDNIVLPNIGRTGRTEPADLRQRIAGLLTAFGAGGELELTVKARHLSPAQARLVMLARALATRAKLYLFDEPFASLAPREIEGLVGVMMRLRMSGCGLVVATRHLDGILPFADRVSVLAEGRTVLAANPHNDEERPQLARIASAAPTPRGDRTAPLRNAVPLLVVSRLAAPPDIVDASFAVRAGEIVALHGLKTSGCAALLRAVGGLQPRSGGGIDLAGAALEPGNPRAASRAGLAIAGPLVLPAGTPRDNLRLRHGDPLPAGGWTLADLWHTLKLPEEALDQPLDTQPRSVRRRVAIACTLIARASVVVLDDPTRGLAPAERAAVHAALQATAQQGRAVLLACPDRDEALAIADRCVVLCEGRTIADLSCPLLDAEAMALLAASPAALARNAAMLAQLTRENGGAAFWALRRESHVICLNAAVADAAADPGLEAPGAAPFAATRIATALSRGEPDFVAEPDGSRTTLLVPIQTSRGRPLGMIGLTLGRDATPPPAAAVAFQVATLAASL